MKGTTSAEQKPKKHFHIQGFHLLFPSKIKINKKLREIWKIVRKKAEDSEEEEEDPESDEGEGEGREGEGRMAEGHPTQR
jgi:hypothetical protein